MQRSALKRLRQTAAIILSLALLSALSACQEKQTGASSDLTLTTQKAPTSVIVTIAKTAQKCWFKSGDPAFKKFRLAAEVNSYAGRPRFLIVPKNNRVF